MRNAIVTVAWAAISMVALFALIALSGCTSAPQPLPDAPVVLERAHEVKVQVTQDRALPPELLAPLPHREAPVFYDPGQGGDYCLSRHDISGLLEILHRYVEDRARIKAHAKASTPTEETSHE